MPAVLPLFQVRIQPMTGSARSAVHQQCTTGKERGQQQQGQQQQQEGYPPHSVYEWSCELAALLPRVVGILDSYSQLCDVRYQSFTYSGEGQSQPHTPTVHPGRRISVEEWESQLFGDLEPLLLGLSLCLPREDEPQHCMLVGGLGSGGHNTGAGEQQQQQQGQGARNVDAEALCAVELGATLLHLSAVARAERAVAAAASGLAAFAQVGATRRALFTVRDHDEPGQLR